MASISLHREKLEQERREEELEREMKAAVIFRNAVRISKVFIKNDTTSGAIISFCFRED